jgi:hypothetical protein
MELNIASVEIEPKRHTFGHVAERLGEDRPASRYEDAMQSLATFSNNPKELISNVKFELIQRLSKSGISL